jgi:Immunity protein 40
MYNHRVLFHEENKMNSKYIDILPADINGRAIWLLEKVGVKEYGWNHNDALRVLEYLVKSNQIILGGDVLEAVNGKFKYTGDNWYFNNDNSKSQEQNIEASYIKATNYIKSYQTNNKGEYIFVLVC